MRTSTSTRVLVLGGLVTITITSYQPLPVPSYQVASVFVAQASARASLISGLLGIILLTLATYEWSILN